MRVATVVDAVLGRARLDVVQGTVACPARAGRLDVELCSACPFRLRTDIDERGVRTVVCRGRPLAASSVTMTPPV